MSKNFVLPGAIAAADLSAKKGYAVKLSTTKTLGTNKVELAGANEFAIGILSDAGLGNGEPVSVIYQGYCPEAVIGGTVTMGDVLRVTSDGTLETSSGTSDNNIIAQALASGVSGDTIPVIVGRFVY